MQTERRTGGRLWKMYLSDGCLPPVRCHPCWASSGWLLPERPVQCPGYICWCYQLTNRTRAALEPCHWGEGERREKEKKSNNVVKNRNKAEIEGWCTKIGQRGPRRREGEGPVTGHGLKRRCRCQPTLEKHRHIPQSLFKNIFSLIGSLISSHIRSNTLQRGLKGLGLSWELN